MHVVKASRKGRNLTDYSKADLGFKSGGRNKTFLGTEAHYERIKFNAYMRNANYGGAMNREETGKRAPMLGRAIALAEQRSRAGTQDSDFSSARPRPGYLGERSREASPGTGPSSPVGEDLARPAAKVHRRWDPTLRGNGGATLRAPSRQPEPELTPRTDAADMGAGCGYPPATMASAPEQRDESVGPGSRRASLTQAACPSSGPSPRGRAATEAVRTKSASPQRPWGSGSGPRRFSSPDSDLYGGGQSARGGGHPGRGCWQERQETTRHVPARLDAPEAQQVFPGRRGASSSVEIPTFREAPIERKDRRYDTDPIGRRAESVERRDRRFDTEPVGSQHARQPRLSNVFRAQPSFQNDNDTSRGSDSFRHSPGKTDLQTSRMSQSVRSDVSTMESPPPHQTPRAQSVPPREGTRMAPMVPTRQPCLRQPSPDFKRYTTVPRVATQPVGLHYRKAEHMSDKYTHRLAHEKYVVHERFHSWDPQCSEQEQLDSDLCTGLCGTSVGRLARDQRSLTSLPMSAAFTDRSMRRREGFGSREALKPGEALSSVEPEPSFRDVQQALALSVGARPAGHPSYAANQNYIRAPHLGIVADDFSSWKTYRDPGYNSGRLQKLLLHEDLRTPRTPRSDTDSLPAWEDRDYFKTLIGSKVKRPIAARRSLSEDPRLTRVRDEVPFTGEAPAGRFFRKIEYDVDCFGKKHQPGIHDYIRRDVGMILSPRKSDPPPNPQITCTKKALCEFRSNADNKLGSYLNMRQWRDPIYRFELRARQDQEQTGRSRSLPPERMLPPDRNPVTCQGFEDPTYRPLKRRPAEFPETQVAHLTNHTLLQQEADQARTRRLENEAKFADLCSLTKDNAGRTRMDGLARTYSSSSVASSLTWDA
mmetsp:Transcript_70298/g.139323  ORF Transcript_70298/g.139323 Transcript_70298/m.139323 type:complete len:878 (+) Transcript_70298:70-2703(+)